MVNIMNWGWDRGKTAGQQKLSTSSPVNKTLRNKEETTCRRVKKKRAQRNTKG
jgi:hypothetical protein